MAADNDAQCIGTGTDVECVYPDGVVLESAGGASSEPAPEGVPALLPTLLLVSPFFFWGTSMVAMKELAPHTTPIFLAAWRLIPAGAALVLWAQQDKRKHPSGWEAWLAIALFGLVDAACFQVPMTLYAGWVGHVKCVALQFDACRASPHP